MTKSKRYNTSCGAKFYDDGCLVTLYNRKWGYYTVYAKESFV